MKKTEFNIRPEVQAEFPEIYSLIRTAFETAKVKDGDEHDFAESLRQGNGYIPQLALVAEIEGGLIGHIMLTKTYVMQSDGSTVEALLLAPIAVLAPYRGKGVGAALIAESSRIAREMGYRSVFLIGDLAYYSRFGFRRTSLFGIVSKNGIPEQYVQVCELVPDALSGVSGILQCC